jgi:hypothetical protein
LFLIPAVGVAAVGAVSAIDWVYRGQCRYIIEHKGGIRCSSSSSSSIIIDYGYSFLSILVVIIIISHDSDNEKSSCCWNGNNDDLFDDNDEDDFLFGIIDKILSIFTTTQSKQSY